MERSRRRVRTKYRTHKLFLLVFSVCILGVGYIYINTQVQAYKKAWNLTSEKKEEQTLMQILKKNAGIESSITVINAKTGQTFSVGDKDDFVAASTTKVIMAACLLSEVELGKRNLNEQLGLYPASYQLQQMVQESNNDSWDAITNYVGLQTLQSYVKKIGIQYDIAQNEITANNEALFLEKLYAGKLLNGKDTKLLLSYMQDTNENDLISATVPSTVTVYHKYGWLDNYIHDAAILIHDGTPIIVVIYTQGNATTGNQQLQLFKPLTESILKYEFGLS